MGALQNASPSAETQAVSWLRVQGIALILAGDR